MCGALLLWLATRPAKHRAPLVRVRPGAPASTQEGHDGVVVDVQGEVVLLAVHMPQADDADRVIGLWVRRSKLREAPASGLDHWYAGRSPEQLRGMLHRLPQPRGLDVPTGYLYRLGRFLFEARATVVAAGLGLVLLCVPLAMTVHGSLSSGGFVPDGEAMSVERDLQERFEFPATEVTMFVPGDAERTKAKLAAMSPALQRIDGVYVVQPAQDAPDGKAVLVNVGLRTTDDAVTREAIADLRAAFDRGGLPQVRMAGRSVFSRDVEEQMRKDLTKAELIGLPLALLVLLLVFGSVVSAAVPVLIGLLSVVMACALTSLIGMAFDVSVFALNVISLLGFGLGIDYSLIAVSRFRRELAKGRNVETATVITASQAGRAILVSASAVLLGLLGLMVVPLGVFRSIAIGGVVVVACTAAMSALLLPALLALIGHRIEALPIRSIDHDAVNSGGLWRRITRLVMDRPALVTFVVLGAAIAVALPARHAQLEVPMQTALPKHAESQRAIREITGAFDEQATASPVLVVARTADVAERRALAARMRAVPNVADVRERVTKDGRTLFTVITEHSKYGGADARTTARDLRELDGEPGLPALDVGGQFAWEQEFFDLLREGMPTVLAIVFGSAFLVLFFAFRSVVIPIKAILLNLVSITATLGIVVLVFQHGFGVDLLGTSQLGWVDASLPLVLFCLLFGLSMDYEVFMLASIAEGWQDGLDTTDATSEGIARTAPLVTGAAMILVVLGLAFTTTELVLVKQIGFGVAVALFLDATIVRALLVPGTMRLLGEWNWWLPDALARRLPATRWV